MNWIPDNIFDIAIGIVAVTDSYTAVKTYLNDRREKKMEELQKKQAQLLIDSYEEIIEKIRPILEKIMGMADSILLEPLDLFSCGDDMKKFNDTIGEQRQLILKFCNDIELVTCGKTILEGKNVAGSISDILPNVPKEELEDRKIHDTYIELKKFINTILERMLNTEDKFSFSYGFERYITNFTDFINDDRFMTDLKRANESLFETLFLLNQKNEVGYVISLQHALELLRQYNFSDDFSSDVDAKKTICDKYDNEDTIALFYDISRVYKYLDIYKERVINVSSYINALKARYRCEEKCDL